MLRVSGIGFCLRFFVLDFLFRIFLSVLVSVFCLSLLYNSNSCVPTACLML